MKESPTRLKYGFTTEDRITARESMGDICQFPGDSCGERPTGRVNHFTGCAIARRLDLDPDPIRDISLNALMLCKKHEDDLDNQEWAYARGIDTSGYTYDHRGSSGVITIVDFDESV